MFAVMAWFAFICLYHLFCKMKLNLFCLGFGIEYIDMIVVTNNITYHLKIVVINFFAIVTIEKYLPKCISTMKFPFNFLTFESSFPFILLHF